MWLSVLQTLFALLTWLAGFLTFAGLVLSAALKDTKLTDGILPYYPRYNLARAAVQILEDLKYPTSLRPGEEDKGEKIAVLDIDHPAWPVMLDFLKSEIAIRKSERSEPSQPTPSGTSSSGQAAQNLPSLPEINFDRVKTIFTVRGPVISAGTKPLTPPFSLVVIWPPPHGRRVYEFATFQEFGFDLRHMIVGEVESFALWLAVVALLCQPPIAGIRWLISIYKKRSMKSSALQVQTPGGEEGGELWPDWTE